MKTSFRCTKGTNLVRRTNAVEEGNFQQGGSCRPRGETKAKVA